MARHGVASGLEREFYDHLGAAVLFGMYFYDAFVQMNDVPGQRQSNPVAAGVPDIGCAEEGIENMFYLAGGYANTLVRNDKDDLGFAEAYGKGHRLIP